MVHSHSFPKIQKLSPKYCTPTRKTKHQWTDDSFLLNLSTLLPLLRESNLDLLRFASLPGKGRFVFFFFLVFKPLQAQQESKPKWLSQPALDFISQPLPKASNPDFPEVPLTSRPSCPQWHQYIQLHDACQGKIKKHSLQTNILLLSHRFIMHIPEIWNKRKPASFSDNSCFE